MRALWSLVYLLKYLLLATIGCIVLRALFTTPIAAGLFLLLLIGYASWDEAGEKCRQQRLNEQKQEQEGEIDGFDIALQSMPQITNRGNGPSAHARRPWSRLLHWRSTIGAYARRSRPD
jgi:hypothetical protein